MEPYSTAIQTKAIEQYFHVVLFIMLYKAMPRCDYSNASYCAILSYFTMYYACKIQLAQKAFDQHNYIWYCECAKEQKNNTFVTY